MTRAELEQVREALKACSDDLELEVGARYGAMLDYPSQQLKHDRDMQPVENARAALAILDRKLAEPERVESLNRCNWLDCTRPLEEETIIRQYPNGKGQTVALAYHPDCYAAWAKMRRELGAEPERRAQTLNLSPS